MNKYQEALEFLIKASDWGCEKCEECSINKLCHKYEAIQTLQELIDKTTPLLDKEMPKKPIPYLNSFFKCGNCKGTFQNHHYQSRCPDCGQKLDWSDINEL